MSAFYSLSSGVVQNFRSVSLGAPLLTMGNSNNTTGNRGSDLNAFCVTSPLSGDPLDVTYIYSLPMSHIMLVKHVMH